MISKYSPDNITLVYNKLQGDSLNTLIILYAGVIETPLAANATELWPLCL